MSNAILNDIPDAFIDYANQSLQKRYDHAVDGLKYLSQVIKDPKLESFILNILGELGE